MGMFTELVLGIEIKNNPDVIETLNYMLGEPNTKAIDWGNEPLFKTERWAFMLTSDSYYFDGRTNSKLTINDIGCYLNVRCNLKNYNDEIKKFMKWLCPYIITDGFLGYTRYEEFDNPTLIYKKDGKIFYSTHINNL